MGVIVAAAMMGGLALMLAQMTKQQAVSQRKAETGLEMNQLHHRILAVLYDGDACLKTMGKGGSLHNGRILDKLLNKGGKPVLEKGVDINRVVRVEQMVIQKVEGSGQTKEAEVWVTIKKLGEANKGSGEILKKFPLTVELDTAGKIASCHHTLDSKEHGIKTRMCEEMGGEMITVPGTPTTACTLTNVYKTFCESLGGSYSEPPAGTPTGECNIKDTYVDQDGDTMTGALTTPAGSKLGGCSESGGSLSCSQNVSAGATLSGANASVRGRVSSRSVNASGNISAGGTVSAGGGGGSGGGGGGSDGEDGTDGSDGSDSSSLSVSCPEGEFLTGIDKGVAQCGKPDGTASEKFFWAAWKGSSDSSCTAAGGTPAADQGYGTCASGENTPKHGGGHKKISYTHGAWSKASHRGGTSISGDYCYGRGQKRDGDGTDIVVAVLCELP